MIEAHALTRRFGTFTAVSQLSLSVPAGSVLALLGPNGAELFRTSAGAKLEDHIMVLRADIDLGGVSPGLYFLGVRQPGLEWTRFPIRLF